FLCGLLNAQPMGFYAPAQLVRDAREHGIEVRPVDVAVSGWESTLEGEAVAPASGAGALGEGLRQPVRLGLNRLKGLAEDAGLRTYPNGRLARASGLVTHRQRPETAKGTVFVTLEDETGAVNVIVWPKVAEVQRKPLLAATLLTVYGQWQRQGEGDEAVMHLVAAKMIDH